MKYKILQHERIEKLEEDWLAASEDFEEARAMINRPLEDESP